MGWRRGSRDGLLESGSGQPTPAMRRGGLDAGARWNHGMQLEPRCTISLLPHLRVAWITRKVHDVPPLLRMNTTPR